MKQTLPLNMDPKITDKVYQMVMWGESREDVFEYLSQQGVGDKDARELYAIYIKERATIIRKKYSCRVVLGAILIFISVCIVLNAIESAAKQIPANNGGAFGFGSAVLVGGVYLAVDGLVKIFTAKSAPGSIASNSY